MIDLEHVKKDLEEFNEFSLGVLKVSNEPPPAKTSPTDTIDMLYAGPSTAIGEIMSTIPGRLCYFVA
ncbi:hypothetical protein F4779DRAFT_569964 [Xylariaceae sp. FL0662B]|nr:hypothetical protein F4779DRAFT_569964 [Xylariaceae sp. FL0662B]